MVRKLFLAVTVLIISLIGASCGSDIGNEDLLIDDSEVYTSQESTQTGSEDGTAEEDSPVDRPLSLVDCDPTLMNLLTKGIWYNDGPTFAADGRYIYHSNKPTNFGDVARFLYRIDQETGEDRILCDDPDCRHVNAQCKAYLGTGNILGMQIYGGELWYFCNEGGNTTNIHIGHTDFSGNGISHDYLMELDFPPMDQKYWPSSPQCFIHRGMIFMVFREITMETFRNGAESYGLYSGTFTITACQPEDLLKEGSETTEERVLKGGTTVFSEGFDPKINAQLKVIPYEDDLYFCTAYEGMDNPEAPMAEWKHNYVSSVYRWSLESQETEELFFEERFISDFWVHEEGLSLLERESDEEAVLVSCAFDGSSPRKQRSFEWWWMEEPCFAGGRLVSRLFDKSVLEADNEENRPLIYKVMNLNGKELNTVECVMLDPRYKDPSKAPLLNPVLTALNEYGLYFTWSEGLFFQPFDGDRAQFYGLEQSE